MKRKIYDIVDLKLSVKNSTSIYGVIDLLGLNRNNGNHVRRIKQDIETYSLDVTHFKGKIWNAGLKTGYKHPLDEYLCSNGRYINSHTLKLRLIDEGIFEHKCNKCGLSRWNDKDIPIELEHKNGEHSDNRLENLEILCPNCHAQTSTYCSKNIRTNKISN